MFTIPKTPQEFFKPLTDFYASMPKTPTASKDMLDKVQAVITAEYANSQAIVKTYQKSMQGDATTKELAEVQKKTAEMVKAATFAGIVSIPGAVFILPAIVEKAKEYKIDLVPKSVAEHFNI